MRVIKFLIAEELGLNATSAGRRLVADLGDTSALTGAQADTAGDTFPRMNLRAKSVAEIDQESVDRVGRRSDVQRRASSPSEKLA